MPVMKRLTVKKRRQINLALIEIINGSCPGFLIFTKCFQQRKDKGAMVGMNSA